MSWDAYVTDSMIGTGHVDKGAIYGAAGDSKWAGTPGFELKPAELKEIIAGFKDPNPLWASGVHVAGIKYVLTLANPDRNLYARKDRDGIVIVKTKQAILVAHYNETMIAGNSAAAIEKLADYLISVGY